VILGRDTVCRRYNAIIDKCASSHGLNVAWIVRVSEVTVERVEEVAKDLKQSISTKCKLPCLSIVNIINVYMRKQYNFHSLSR